MARRLEHGCAGRLYELRCRRPSCRSVDHPQDAAEPAPHGRHRAAYRTPTDNACKINAAKREPLNPKGRLASFPWAGRFAAAGLATAFLEKFPRLGGTPCKAG